MTESINTLIRKQLTGQISAEEQTQLDAWLALHPEAQSDYQALLDGEQLARRYREYASADSEKAWQQFSRRHYPHIEHRRSRRQWLAAASVAVLLAAGGLIWFTRHSRQPATAVQQQVVITTVAQPVGITVSHEGGMVHVAVPRGMTHTLRLDDGTEVTLNADSRLSYAEHFTTGNERRVSLSGEAYFRVAHDAAHPFYVESPQVVTRVLGTEFNVRDYESTVCHVTLVQGSVTVKDVRRNTELRLSPGQDAIVSDTEQLSLHDTAADTDALTAWTEDLFSFHNETLENIMRDIGRWYNVTVVFTSQDISQLRFNFWAERADNPAEVLEQLNATGKVKAEQDGNRIIIDHQ